MDVRRADERFATRLPWLDSHHSFSFSRHYDPTNTHHGLLLVNNDDVVRAGTGFTTHPHQDMEIVTWVLSGELEHKDSAGHTGLIYPGLAQRMSAGTGIWHSEMNPSAGEDVHFVQMWVLPDTERIDPGYEQLDVNAELDKGDWCRSPRAAATMPPSPSASATPCSGAGGWAPATRSSSPIRGSPTSSSLGATLRWMAPAACTQGTPLDSPRPAPRRWWPTPTATAPRS